MDPTENEGGKEGRKIERKSLIKQRGLQTNVAVIPWWPVQENLKKQTKSESVNALWLQNQNTKDNQS